MTGSISNNMHDLLVKLLTQLGNMNINGFNSLASNATSGTSPTLVQHNTPIASQAGPTHDPTLPPSGFIPLQAQPTSYYINAGPPGFVPPPTQPSPTIQPGQPMYPTMGPMIYDQPVQPTGLSGPSVQAATLPHAFYIMTLQDLSSGA
ncbi:hypothetical protein Tco_1366093 [Tanacetum coccineum]